MSLGRTRVSVKSRGSRAARAPGRPVSAEKRRQILRVATDTFLERGFVPTSMDLIARRAGVSKVTVYSHFKSKEALFGAIVDELVRRLLARLDRVAIADRPPDVALRHLGRLYLELALAASSLALHRFVVAETARIGGLGRVIYENGPVQLVGALSDFLRQQRGLSIADPRLAAEQFYGMVLGHAQLRLLLKARPARDVRAAIGASVDHAVDIFLNGVAHAR